jgi:pantoate--beta-alanine ligase
VTEPAVVTTIADLRSRLEGRRVALVPTMGALHDGHLALVDRAAELAEVVVVSIFVNPLQFGAGEDLDRYPRTLDDDLKICEREGVDIVFAPSVEEVYPGGDPQISLKAGPLGKVLEGKVRPGHFRGVLTVVAKLFGLVRPDVAVFGQKDYQQLALIRRMVLDLNMGVDVVGAETVREYDGLALSSRNRYLDDEQRQQALALNRTLRAAQEVERYGPDVALDSARAQLRAADGVDLDYLVITDADLGDLPAAVPPGTEARILIAARVGSTRLIDNMPLVLGEPVASREGAS